MSCSRTASGTSSRSGPLRYGRITSVIPARCAASTFCFTPPIGSTLPWSVTSPVIATSARTGPARQQAGERGGHRDAGRRTVLRAPRPRARARGSAASVVPGLSPSSSRCASHERQRDLRRLLHHVAELTGQGQAGLAVHHRRLDEQHVTAGTGDREPRRDARRRRALRGLGEELRPAEQRADVVGVDDDRRLGVAGRDLRRDLAQHLAELTLEVADAGLARVVGDDEPQRVVGDARPRPRSGRGSCAAAARGGAGRCATFSSSV